MTGGAGRHAAPYLHHLPCALREKDCQPIASLSCPRLVTAKSGGFPQKQAGQAGQDFVRSLSGSTVDRRRLLSTQTHLTAGLEAGLAGCPQPGSCREGHRGTQRKRDRHAKDKQWDAAVSVCSLIARCVDANRKSCGLLAFFSLGSPVGEVDKRADSRGFAVWEWPALGLPLPITCAREEERRRRDSAYFESSSWQARMAHV